MAIPTVISKTIPTTISTTISRTILTKKYINEINRLKTINTNLEEDLVYYKELNNRYLDDDKRTTIFETENIKLQNLLQQKNEEIDSMKIKHKKLEEEKSTLETQLVNSKGKLGEVLNELAEAETKCVHLEKSQEETAAGGTKPACNHYGSLSFPIYQTATY